LKEDLKNDSKKYDRPYETDSADGFLRGYDGADGFGWRGYGGGGGYDLF
jgi:hypothetical protein